MLVVYFAVIHSYGGIRNRFEVLADGRVRACHVLHTKQPEAALSFVATKFALTDYETNAKNAILVDFYLWILMFCKEHGFNEEKSSAAFTIVLRTHEFAMSGSKPVQETFAEFKRLVLMHSLAGVPDALVLFTPQDVTELTKFVTNTYMQHYRLYQYANLHEQEKDEHVTHFFVDTPAAPPPLALAKQEIDNPQPEAPKEEVPAEPPTEAEKEPEPELTEEERVSRAVAAILAEKTALMEEAMQAQMAIKMETLSKTLTGLGV